MGSHFFFGCCQGQRLRYHTIANRVSHSGRLIGLQPNRSSVARRWEGAALQLSLRPRPPFLPHHFQHPRQLRRRLRHRLSLPQDHQHPVDLWIHSTAQSILRTLGLPIRRSGAAESTTAAALQPHRRCSPSLCQLRSLSRRPILTIAQMVSQTGKQVGQWQKKEWCCRVHGKGCPNQGGGCVTSSKPYDCNAGFANWMAGWSVAKKAWCCSNEGKGC